MEAGNVIAEDARERDPSRGVPAWVLGLVPLLLIVAAVGAFSALGAPGLGERREQDDSEGDQRERDEPEQPHRRARDP